ncbi:IclR family transcriptional regulator [Haloarcula sp. 1CSR25-25]|uniref:IclR family transcriptional regulator n=1 Tax=Haloarcula sp. 1CSR25-25 TaxID=2862545 RepID=UPI002894C9BD|nr:IclR family transcriptional regulator [Haloarcula sp. 1CSR25-25]MDT3437288.1 IclR family transcriptional regulator [Haloarcula sp. 1CSR25-25]
MTRHDSSKTVEAVQKILGMIEFLLHQDGAGITEIADELGRSKGPIHGHMSTLYKNEYVIKEDKTYRLSLHHLKLGETVRDRLQIYDVVTEELDNISLVCGGLAEFAMSEHEQAVYIYKSAGENTVQSASSPGTKINALLSLGKAMMAHMSESRINEIIERHRLPKYTENTITTREALFAELEEIRISGYAFDREEKIQGLRCVAAPVTTETEIIGAISISGPASRFEGEFYEEELPGNVTRSAYVIEINSQFS